MFKLVGFLVIVAGIYAFLWPSIRKAAGRPVGNSAKIGPAILILCLIIGVLLISITTVPSGHVGVVTTFGKVNKTELSEGINVVMPWKKTTNMTIQTQELFQELEVPSKEGLSLSVETSLQYHIMRDEASTIYQKIGKNYEEKIIIPIFRSALRDATTQFEAKALYTADRSVVTATIRKQMEEPLAEKGIEIEKILLRAVILPAKVKGAIETKLKAEQDAEAMKFVLEKETQEADRKRIEAKGIQDFQDIVARGLDDRFLKWKGIEATENLSNSPNSKIVVIGNSDGLPLILNQ